MKIMIVDDEVIIRSGMAKVINWSELGLELLEPAASAEEVLERLEREQPDILMTDIRMTGKTGLELAEEAQRQLPDLEIVIFTGYDDFVYMQNAIRQNVSDYLLKTSRPEEIIKTVLKVKRRIEEKWAARCQDRFTSLKRRQTAYERWIADGDLTATDLVWPEEFMPGARRATGRGLKVMHVLAEGWSDAQGSVSLLLFAVNNALADLLPCVSFVQKKRIVLAVTTADTDVRKQHYRSVFEKVERVLKCRLIVIAGNRVESVEQLHASFLAAEETYRYRRLMRTCYWEYDDIRNRTGGKSMCTVDEEKDLAAILLEGNPLTLKHWVHSYIQALLDDDNCTPQSFEGAVQSVALSARRWLERMSASTGKEPLQPDLIQPLRDDPEQLPENVLFQHVYGLMKLYHNELSAGQRTHINKAIAFIEENIGRNLSLQQTAQHVHLHPGHLSVVFKKETGMTYRDYVMKVKMKHAMNILRDYPAKISDVAAGVGYDDVKYFGQVFKKFTGKTPSEYREEMMVRSGK